MASPVIIVGAGIVGTAAALTLARKGVAVALIDPQAPGSGASSGNAGCLNPSSIIPVSTPGVLWSVPKWLLDPDGPLVLRWRYLPTLAPWLARFLLSGRPERVRAQAHALRALTRDAVEATMELSRGTLVRPLVRHAGGLVVYRSMAAFDGEAFAMGLRRSEGIEVEEIDTDRLHEMEPDLSRDHVRARLYRGNGHIVDPEAFVAGLAETAVRLGATLHRAHALDFCYDAGRVTHVVTDEGVLPASAVVLAAGAHSAPLARRLGDRVPLETERGYHVMLPQARVGPRLPTMSAEYRIVATAMTAGLRVAGTVELASLAAPPSWSRAARLADMARALYPGLARENEAAQVSHWMGFRPSLPDSLPVIGVARNARNAFHAFGHGHVGLTAGARTGQIAAALVEGDEPGLDLAPYSPRRF